MGRMLFIPLLLLCIVLVSFRQWKLLIGVIVAGVAGMVAMTHFLVGEQGGPPAQTIETVRMLCPEDKAGLLRDIDIRRILKEKHHLVVETVPSDPMSFSIEMAEGVDALWFSGPVSEALYRKRTGTETPATPVFSVALALYAWEDAFRALRAKAIFEFPAETETSDALGRMPHPGRLMELVVESSPWRDLGLRGRKGPVGVFVAPPENHEAGALGLWTLTTWTTADNSTSEGRWAERLIETQAALPALPSEPESGNGFFRAFLQEGEWKMALVLAEDFRVTSFYETFPAHREKIDQSVRVVFPTPTLLFDQSLMPMTAGGERLLMALLDAEIQEITWRKYGYRPAVVEKGIADSGPVSRLPLVLPLVLDDVRTLPPEAVDIIIELFLNGPPSGETVSSE